jgi:hypothetical protein
MVWGKKFASAIEQAKLKHPTDTILKIKMGKQTIPVHTYSKVEHPFKVVFNGIPLVGYADTFCDETKRKIRDYKTSKVKWDQAKCDEHPQATMYVLMNYISHKIPPEEVEFVFDVYKTREHGDFTVSFAEPIVPTSYTTRRTMTDILRFGQRINKTVEDMITYANSREKDN